MFRQWLCIGLLVLISTPPWAQDNSRAIRREREERQPEQRVALVIGNGQYEHIKTLRNPVNDAQGMARVLKKIGFEVIELIDGKRIAMRDSIYKFEALIHREVEVALFYFAGHGLRIKDEDRFKNYLVPIDANMQREHEVPEACISANWVLRILQAREGNRVNIIILDACRNNPFESRSFRTTGGQGVVGLASMSAPSGSVIAYAADAGQVAWDGEGKHSPYTGSLIRHISTPGATIFEVFTRVAGDVRKATLSLNSTKPQEPWLRTNLTQNFSFIPSSDPPDTTTIIDPSPLCVGQPSGSACWMELADQPQCYIWNPNFKSDRTVVWTGECSNGFAQGEGTLEWFLEDGKKYQEIGVLRDGKRQGHWLHQWTKERASKSTSDKATVIIRMREYAEEGPYVDGKRHGHWEIRFFGILYEGPYVDGKKHGHWSIRNADGKGLVEEGPYVYGKQTGDWTQKYANGTVSQGPYIDGKRHGRWSIRYKSGNVHEGPYVDDQKTGDWVIRYANGTVSQGPYVDGKRHGRWSIRYKSGIVYKGPYVDDERHGRWTVHYPRGRDSIINYRNGERVSDN